MKEGMVTGYLTFSMFSCADPETEGMHRGMAWRVFLVRQLICSGWIFVRQLLVLTDLEQMLESL